MRQLLIAGLGAAGLLLVNLPAPAQLSNDTSTFNGEVAATCSFDGMADSYSMDYWGSVNYLRGSAQLSVASNAPSLRVSVSRVTTNSEPAANNGASVYVNAYLYQYHSGTWNLKTTGTKGSTGTSLPINISQGDNFNLTAMVYTNNRIGNKYQLSQGQYSYTVTLSCLL